MDTGACVFFLPKCYGNLCCLCLQVFIDACQQQTPALKLEYFDIRAFFVKADICLFYNHIRCSENAPHAAPKAHLDSLHK